MPGLYISVPFCRSKCSYCNFASGVFSRTAYSRYVDRVCADMGRAPQIAAEMGGQFERRVDSIYLGGGTPSMLPAADLDRLFHAVRQNFEVTAEAEITVECAPGTLTPAVLEALLRWGVNRISLGMQSFMDGETAAVGRLHTRATTLDDIARLRAAGIANINLDLIAGLPHQTRESWLYSLVETLATCAPHVSVYMLEVDEESRLGKELIAGGTRYHAHFVPDEDATADFYLMACEQLEAGGVRQYEISNFARAGCQSRHNTKYWTRQPYLGFGVDAHSLLAATGGAVEMVRFSTSDSLDEYLESPGLARTDITTTDALEETFFLGLRLTRGVNLKQVAARFGAKALAPFLDPIAPLRNNGLLELEGDVVRLTARGRLLSNEVFQRFIDMPQAAERRSF